MEGPLAGHLNIPRSQNNQKHSQTKGNSNTLLTANDKQTFNQLLRQFFMSEYSYRVMFLQSNSIFGQSMVNQTRNNVINKQNN